jgi:UDP-N-acetylglucosamine--N-acetylmuramyl-(pentapeptide) pyrophosphoryl-undecaprenol N-acetylglucosamine transferase
LPQSELTPERLAREVTQLFADPKRLKEMSERARALSHHDAAGRVARMVAELAKSIG